MGETMFPPCAPFAVHRLGYSFALALRLRGGVAERSNAAVSKTVSGGFVRRGFKSLPLRLPSRSDSGSRVAGYRACVLRYGDKAGSIRDRLTCAPGARTGAPGQWSERGRHRP